jgi:hypothetical protein
MNAQEGLTKLYAEAGITNLYLLIYQYLKMSHGRDVLFRCGNIAKQRQKTSEAWGLETFGAEIA